MSERDELIEIVNDATGFWDDITPEKVAEAADKILARWRLVPMGESDQHECDWVPAVWNHDDRTAKKCVLCGTLELRSK